MLGREARREARVRRRGRPAHATITDARPLDAAAPDGTPAGRRWRLRLWVAPHDRPGFEATLVTTHPWSGGPGVGGGLEVLHHRGRVVPARATRRAPATGQPSGAPPAAVRTAATPVAPEAPPDPLELLGDVLGHLAAAAGAAGGPPPITPTTGAATPLAGTAGPGMSVAHLAALAGRDADGAADEILRRIDAGETTAVLLVGEARRLDPAGRAGALAALRALHERGAIDDARMTLVRMLLDVNP